MATKPFEMTPVRRQAAEYVAEGLLSDLRIADMVGVTQKTVWSWRHNPIFIAYVAKLRAAAEEAALNRFASQRSNRLNTLDDLYRGYRTIAEERAEAFARDDPHIPGGKTGLIVRRERVIGLGQHSERITEYVIDQEIRQGIESLGKEVGIESGQRTEKKELSGPGGSPLFSIVELAVELTDDDPEAALDPLDDDDEGGSP